MRILSTNGVRDVLKHRDGVKFDTTTAHKAEIERGAPFDIAILTSTAIDDLLKKGLLLAPAREVSRSGIGVVVRKGSPVPDVSTVDAIKRALLAAESIAYVEGSITAGHLPGILAKLGIAPRTRAVTGMLTAEAVARGIAELGLTQISEIVGVAGVELAGPLPPELQVTTVFSAAVSPKAPEAAKKLLQALP